MPMHVKELLLLAADVVLTAPQAPWCQQSLPPDALNEYWLASKARMDLWFAQMKRFRQESPMEDAQAQARAWDELCGTLEELLASEMLTRVWAAAVTLWEQDRPREAEPVARSVVVAHSEARLRAMMLLLHASGVPAEDALRLNHLRRRAQRWCDLLIARLGTWGPVTHWAHDPDRALELAQELRPQRSAQSLSTLRMMLRSSLQSAFWNLLTRPAASRALNRRIHHSIARWLPQPWQALPKSSFPEPWPQRLERISDYAMRLVEDLVSLDGGSSAASPRE